MEQSSGIVLAVAMPVLLGMAAYLKKSRLNQGYSLVRTPRPFAQSIRRLMSFLKMSGAPGNSLVRGRADGGSDRAFRRELGWYEEFHDSSSPVRINSRREPSDARARRKDV